MLKVPELSCPLICAGGKLGWLCQRQWNSANTELLRTNQVLLSLKDSDKNKDLHLSGNQGGFPFLIHITTE